jgi:hypothetical protein
MAERLAFPPGDKKHACKRKQEWSQAHEEGIVMKGKGKVAMKQMMRSPQTSTPGTLPASQGVKDAFGIKARLLRGEHIKDHSRAQRYDQERGALDDD